MTNIHKQCDEATQTKIALGRAYNADCQAGNIIEFLKQVHTVCFRRDDRGLSFAPYKQVVYMKLMNSYSNNKPHDPYGFKEEIQIKFDAVKTEAEQFPNGTGATMELLRVGTLAVDQAGYCLLPPTQQLVWEERGGDLTKLMLFLMNLKNNNAKEDLHLAYSQENKTAYPLSIEAMARYMSMQYPNKNPGHQRDGKRGDKNGKKR